MHTVNEMFDKYEREQLPKLSGRSRGDYSRHIKKLRQHFGTKRLRAVTRQEIKDFVTVTKGPVQRMRMISVLRVAYKHALKWGWVDGNPCAHIETNRPRKRDPELTIDEFNAALRLASKSRAGFRTVLVMELALHTGQLQGDIIGLRWSQVDNQAGAILFRDSHSKKKIPVVITPEIRQLLDTSKKLCGDREYVITSRNHTRYTSEGFRAVWQRFLKKWVKTGNDRFLFHDIRQLSKRMVAAKKEENTADPVDNYPQFNAALKTLAARNTPYYKVLFCLEQLIRERIIETIEKVAGADWWESDRIQQSMRQEVNSLVTREIDSAITQRSQRMIDYTTLGQLGQIIRDNWDLFENQFVSKGAVSAVLARLNLARGPIAHCCPVSELEVERLGLAVRDWFNILKSTAM